MSFVKNTHKSGCQHIGKHRLLRPGEVVEVEESELPRICGDFVEQCDADGKVIGRVKVVKVRGHTRRPPQEDDEQPEPEEPAKRPTKQPARK